MPFFPAIVEVVDENGVRVDKPAVDGSQAPIRLKLGDNLTATSTPNGGLTEVRLDAAGASGTIALADHNAFRALDLANLQDKEVITFQSPPGTFVYATGTGAGVVDDDQNVLRNTNVVLGANGRAYNVNTSAILPTTAALRLATWSTQKTIHVQSYSTVGDNGGGDFEYDPTDTTSLDNTGTVIVAGARRYKRQFHGPMNVLWFGAKGDFTADDAPAINAAIAAAGLTSGGAQSGRVFLPFPKAGGGYKILSSIVFPAGADHMVWLDGEVSGGDGNACRIDFRTGGSSSAAIDVAGTSGTRISNIDLFCSGNAKYGIVFRPSGGTGANNLKLVHVNIWSPRDTPGAAAICHGDPGANTVQASELYVENCILTGNAGDPAYQPVAYTNTHGGNVKCAWFTNVSILGFAHCISGNISGPFGWDGGGASNNHLSILDVASADVTLRSVNIETNSPGCQLLTGSQGSADGCVAFEGCNMFLDFPLDHRAIDWKGGMVVVRGGHLQNQKQITITNVTNATPMVVTVAAGHQLVSGMRVQIDSVVGATGANTPDGSIWDITVSGNNVTLVGSSAGGVYVSGGIMTTEPRIFLGDNNVTKRGWDSTGLTWYGVVGTLPIYQPDGTRLTVPATLQSVPQAIRSFGDVSYRPFGSVATTLAAVMCNTPNFPSLPAGVMHSSSTGVVTSSSVARSEEAAGTLLGQIKRWNGSAWVLVGMISSALADGDSTKSVADGSLLIMPAATLGANHTLTLDTTGAVPFESITVERYDTGSHTYAVVNGGGGGGTLYTFPGTSVPRAAVFQMNAAGTDWVLTNTVSLNVQAA